MVLDKEDKDSIEQGYRYINGSTPDIGSKTIIEEVKETVNSAVETVKNTLHFEEPKEQAMNDEFKKIELNDLKGELTPLLDDRNLPNEVGETESDFVEEIILRTHESLEIGKEIFKERLEDASEFIQENFIDETTYLDERAERYRHQVHPNLEKNLEKNQTDQSHA
jgi:hypothetical protein